jgi:hypothetical protein
MKNTYKIPEGCTSISIEQIGNKIVTEFKTGFKKGDILVASIESEFIYISGGSDKVIFMIDKGEKYVQSETCIDKYYHNIRLATQPEKQLLFDALAKAGKQWNAETLQIEDLKVEPKVGDYVGMNYGIAGFVYCVVKSNNHQIHSNFFLDSLTGVQKYGAFSFYKSVEILTPTQFQSAVNALGFEYDFKTDTFKEMRWVPKEGEKFWCVYFTLIPYPCTNDGESIDKELIKVGNFFKTKSECESAIEKIKNLLKSK